jgi:pseudo-response regulator 7
VAGGGSGSGSGNDMYQNRFPQREAALNKFRLKRKDRNFGKKVACFQLHACCSSKSYNQ